MRKLSFLLIGLLTGCSFLSSYIITFTTVDGASIDPAVNTLDFVVNAPVLAYLSEVDCEGSEDIVLLPVVTDGMQVKTAHNLSLAVLAGQAPGTECDLTVTAFDQTTTATAQASIEVVIAGELDVPVVEETPVVEEPAAEETPAEVAPVEEVSSPEVEVEAALETETEAGTEAAAEIPAE